MKSIGVGCWCSGLLVSGWLVACGDPGPVDADGTDEHFQPVCGQDGPVELVQMGTDEEITMFRRIGDTDDFHVRVAAKRTPHSDDPEDERLNVVIDECGEELAELGSSTRFLTWRGDLLFGCIEDDLVWLDDYDDPSPSIVARSGCYPRLVGEHWFIVDAEDDATVASLMVVDTEGSAPVVRELVDDILVDDGSVRLKDRDGELFVQSPTLSVDRVDPRTGAREPLLEQAASGKWSVDGDFIVYQRPWADSEEPTPLVVRDRWTGDEQIVDPGLAVDQFSLADNGLLSTRSLRPGPEPPVVRWFRTDPLRSLDVPHDMQLIRERDDGSFLLLRTDPSFDDFEVLVWREDDDPTTAWSCSSCRSAVFASAPDYFDILFEFDQPSRNEVWRFEDAGGAPLHLGSVMNSAEPLDDGRVLAVLVDDPQDHGPLVLSSDPEEPAVVLADDVEHRSIALTLNFDRPGEIVYIQHGDDGSSTVQRARLAP